MKTIMILMLCAAFVGCKNLPDLPDLPKIPAIPVPQPEPTPEPEPTPVVKVHPDHVNWYGRSNKGGHGLYKPWDYENPAEPKPARLWLLDQRIRPSHIKTVGIYEGNRLVRYCNWPTGVGDLSGKPIDGSQVFRDPTHPLGWGFKGDETAPSFYHANRVKIRNARIDAEGQELRVTDIFDQVIAVMKPIERNVRQGK